MNRILVLLLVLCTSLSFGKFGLNKVQYQTFEWKKIQTEHFDIYYAQGGKEVALYAADHIELIYEHASQKLDYNIRSRIPIIIHNSHSQFQQTNVIRYPIPEAVGGFTEVFKNRIVLPFNGSYPQFYHVLEHELVHGMVFNMFNSSGMRLAQRMSRIPLWFSEGLAEFVSLDWDINSEFFMMDAISYGYITSPAEGMHGFLAYRGGQSFLNYVEEFFGEGTVRAILKELVRGYSIKAAFKIVTNISLKELGDLWLRELRRIYWPELGHRKYAKSIARRLTYHFEDQSFYNLSPSLSPDGNYLAFFSDRDNREAVYIYDLKKDKVTFDVVQSGIQGTHESFHSFSSGITWGPDSRRIALVSKQQGKDVIHVFDIRSKKILDVIDPDLEGVLSPDWSKDGSKMAFSGLKRGKEDLYLYDFETKKIRRLMNDFHADSKPKISPSGTKIAFESDRSFDRKNDYHRHDKQDLYVYDLSTNAIEKVSSGPWDSKMPEWVKSDSLLSFVSNKSGIDNIYLKNLYTDSVNIITNILSGSFTPSFDSSGTKMTFALFEFGGWDIYLIENPLGKMEKDTINTSFFIENKKDNKPFYQTVPLQNLSSYRDTLQLSEEKKRWLKKQKQENCDSCVVVPEKIILNQDSASASEDTLTNIDSLEIYQSVGFYPDTANIFLKSDVYLNNDSTYKEYNYETQWTLDQASAIAGVDNVNGFGGQGYLTFTDLMGDKEIVAFINSVDFGIENVNAFFAYNYLPHRIDIGYQFFHNRYFSEELYYSISDSTIFSKVYGDQHAGVGLALSYPFSMFSRLEFNNSYSYIYREEQASNRYGSFKKKSGGFNDEEYVVQSGLSYNFDNTHWGIVGPIEGSRLHVNLETMYPVQDFGYWAIETDLRKYYRFKKTFTLAARFSSGHSRAWSDKVNPKNYLLGGDEFTFTTSRNRDNYTIALEDRFFSSIETPLRGYRYFDFRGDNMMLFNLEFRYPFINHISFILLSLRNVMGAIFMDYGGSWYGDPWIGSDSGKMGLGYGYGIRMNLGIFVFRYSKAWSDHSVGDYRHGSRSYWSLGAEF